MRLKPGNQLRRFDCLASVLGVKGRRGLSTGAKALAGDAGRLPGLLPALLPGLLPGGEDVRSGVSSLSGGGRSKVLSAGPMEPEPSGGMRNGDRLDGLARFRCWVEDACRR